MAKNSLQEKARGGRASSAQHTDKRARALKKKRLRTMRVTLVLGIIARLIIVSLILFVLLLQRMFVGPSRTVSSLLTTSLTQTSALKFVPRLFLREETVNAFIDAGIGNASNARVDTSLIHIVRNSPAPTIAMEGFAAATPTPAPSVTLVPETATASDSATPPEAATASDAAFTAHVINPETSPAPVIADEQPITIEAISGDTYKGYVMIVKDPSRVFIGVGDATFRSSGKKLDFYCEKYDAIAGTNASGFEDENGGGNGGVPKGLVISEGKLLWGADRSLVVAGFDDNDILHVGAFTTEEAKALKLRDAASWGPALVINGVPEQVGSDTTGLNPRTAIGQRADGAVIFVVIDGRHLKSLGATYTDLVKIMLRYGAVNACNMDGGSSSVLFYNGERVSDVAPLTGSRGVPTAFLVRREAE